MVTVTEKNPIIGENGKEIIIKSVNIEEAKNSISLVYRLDKDGKPCITGFEIKVYGDKSAVMQSQADQLIRYGLERQGMPIPKGGD